MLCAGAKEAYCLPQILPYPRRYSPLRHTVRLFAAQSPHSVKMSSAANPSQIIQYIVFFKVKPNVDPSKLAAMASNLSSPMSLDNVLHITADPLLRCQSSLLAFTHMLHSRCASKADLDAYYVHPPHVVVVNEYVNPICDDIMDVYWASEVPTVVTLGSAMMVTFLKLNEGLQKKDKDEVLRVVGGNEGKVLSN